MKILIYSTHEFEKNSLSAVVPAGVTVQYVKEALSVETVSLAKGYDCGSIFTGDDAGADVINKLAAIGIKFIAVRAAGYDNVDLNAALSAGIKVANVPAYSPYSIAEHTVTMALALNRKILTAHEQVHQHNFTVDNLIGFDLNRKTVGIIGTGRIGSLVAKIFNGFGCNILAHDLQHNEEIQTKYNVQYTSLSELCRKSDVITIHLPLTPGTKYLIDREIIMQMKPGVILINTARGGVLKTEHAIAALTSGQIGYLGLDVYENEKGIFFSSHPEKEKQDKMLAELLNHPRVLITPHQGFATSEAISNIAATTFQNIISFMNGQPVENELTVHAIPDRVTEIVV